MFARLSRIFSRIDPNSLKRKWAVYVWQVSIADKDSTNIICSMSNMRGVDVMYGTFGGYTRWAVVFLIIFVLFFLLVPGYGAGAGY
jgi:hypothetical protein